MGLECRVSERDSKRRGREESHEDLASDTPFTVVELGRYSLLYL